MRGFSRVLAFFFLVVFAAGPGFAQQVRFNMVARDLVQRRLRQFGGDDSRRESALKQMFVDAGCRHLDEQPVSGLKQPNVICLVPGSGPETIVVGAHFDHVDRGSGVVDNWSGASLLPSLMQSLLEEPRRHTYIFIGFSGEEQGEIGSHFYVHNLTPEQKSKLEAMVNMDTLGLGPSEVWASRADPGLVQALGAMAKALNLPLTWVNVERVGSTDSEQFRVEGIPAITIHSLTQQTLSVLHSPNDNLDKIKFDDYYRTYRLIAGFLAYLDGEWKVPATNQNTKAEETK